MSVAGRQWLTTQSKHACGGFLATGFACCNVASGAAIACCNRVCVCGCVARSPGLQGCMHLHSSCVPSKHLPLLLSGTGAACSPSPLLPGDPAPRMPGTGLADLAAGYASGSRLPERGWQDQYRRSARCSCGVLPPPRCCLHERCSIVLGIKSITLWAKFWNFSIQHCLAYMSK